MLSFLCPSVQGLTKPPLTLGLLTWLLVLSCSSCAYKWGFHSGILPGGYHQVSIPILKNRTQKVGIESYFTNALRREFHRSRGVSVQSTNLAPVTIEGSIEHIDWKSSAIATGESTFESERTAPFLPPKTVLTTEYRVTVHIQLTLRKKSDNRILWKGSLKHEKAYPAPQVGLEVVNTSNTLYNNSAQIIVLREIATEMMAEARRRMTENF